MTYSIMYIYVNVFSPKCFAFRVLNFQGFYIHTYIHTFIYIYIVYIELCFIYLVFINAGVLRSAHFV